MRYGKCVYTYEDMMPRVAPTESDKITYLRKLDFGIQRRSYITNH